MSAYIVERETIDRVLTFLLEGCDAHQNGFNGLKRWINEKYGYDLAKESHVTTLGQAMMCLNFEAVNARYRETTPASAYEYKRHKSLAFVTIYQAVKSLDCFLYQCSEGNVPDTALFKMLDMVRNTWCRSIVTRTDQYDKAAWA